MRFQLSTMLIVLTSVTIGLAFNVLPDVDVSGPTNVCPIIGFNNVPPEYSHRVPGPSTYGTKVPVHLLTEDFSPRVVTTKRGWPFHHQNDRGYLYDVGNGITWYGIPDSVPSSTLFRISYWKLTANFVILMLPAVALILISKKFRSARVRD
jgi:hypothetical protein